MIGRWINTALTGLRAFLSICIVPWAMIATAGFVIQTVRIDGLHVWPIKITGLLAERDLWRSAEHDWRRAFQIMRSSYDVVHTAIVGQTAGVRLMKAESDAKTVAGKAALAEAVADGEVRERSARAIDAAPSTSCRTSDAVMAAKGEL
ncbi:hypothetical protein [Novosphingobium sp.]|uniref:hypothetical protein n=1 Tax=Novosphingobium sp. TaxID=1874826 RepID=UPI002FDE8A88